MKKNLKKNINKIFLMAPSGHRRNLHPKSLTKNK